MVIPHVLLPIRSVVFVRLLFLVAVVDSVMFDCSIALGGRILRSLRFRSLHFESDQSQSASYDRIGKALLKVYEMVYWNILPSFHLVEKRQPMENHKTEAMTHSTTRPEHSS
ncbi:hypothetical protein VTN49DRAFT_2999 [Thermomyces lanuginosus]|uniref:uncharacterized protein n=1 Tax=Thermomyces lanuginosus TaxID=5541 RepID=UPI0037424804